MNSTLTRRGLLKASVSIAGAAAVGRLTANDWMRPAHAEGERSALLVIYLNGGYNACFSSADSFKNLRFGVNDGNIADLGNGLVVDRATLGSLPAYAREHMATIGIRHGVSDHNQSHGVNWLNGGRNRLLQMAAAMGGDAAIKAPILGYGLDDYMEPPPEGSISLQRINDMRATLDSLGASAANPRMPDRAIAAGGIAGAQAMSDRRLGANPKSLGTLRNGFVSATGALAKPAQPIVYSDIASAYGKDPNDTRIDPFDLRAQMVGAELMLRAGANVATVVSHARELGSWDTHGSVDAMRERNAMAVELIPMVNTMLTRMLGQPDLNLVVAIFGDFARDADNDHAVATAATVLGKYVKVGTTGRTNARAELPAGTPGPQQFFAYLAKVLRVPTEPFGANPHALVV